MRVTSKEPAKKKLKCRVVGGVTIHHNGTKILGFEAGKKLFSSNNLLRDFKLAIKQLTNEKQEKGRRVITKRSNGISKNAKGGTKRK